MAKAILGGENGERLISKLLIHDGWAVIDVNELGQDGAPTIKFNGDEIVLPDLIAIKNGGWAFFEVKTKEDGPNPIRKRGGRLQHGFNKRHYEHYTKVEQITKTPVYVCFWEQPREYQEVRYGRLKNLKKAPVITNEHIEDYGGDMVFFWRDQLESTPAHLSDVDREVYYDGEPLEEINVGGVLPVDRVNTETRLVDFITND